MDPSSEDKLISLWAEIYSDIRQTKSDLQSLLTLLKQQQQKPTPASFPIVTIRGISLSPSLSAGNARGKRAVSQGGARQRGHYWIRNHRGGSEEPIRVRGEIQSLSGNTLNVRSYEGKPVELMLDRRCRPERG